MKKQLNLILIAVLFVISFGCSKKRVSVQEHEAEFETTVRPLQTVSQSQAKSEIDRLYEVRYDISQRIDRASQEKDLDSIIQITKELAAATLNLATIRTREISTSSKYKYVLDLTHKALITFIEHKHPFLTESGILELYGQNALKSCTNGLYDCFELKIFQSSPMSLSVFKYFAIEQAKRKDSLLNIKKSIEKTIREDGKTCKTEVDGSALKFNTTDCHKQFDLVERQFKEVLTQELKLLSLLYKLRNRTDDREIDLLFAKDGMEFLRYAETDEKLKISKKSIKEILSFVIGRLADSKDQTGKSIYCQAVMQINPLGTNDPLAASYLPAFISCAREAKSLTAKIDEFTNQKISENKARAAIEVEQFNSDKPKGVERSHVTYSLAYRYIEDKGALKAFGITEETQPDALFYLIDGVYQNLLDSSQASTLYQSIKDELVQQRISQIKKNSADPIVIEQKISDLKYNIDLKLLKKTEVYIKTIMAFHTRSSYQVLGRTISEYYNKNGSLGTESYLDLIEEIKNKLKDRFVEVKQSYSRLSGFLDKLSQPYVDLTVQTDSFKKTRATFDELASTIDDGSVKDMIHYYIVFPFNMVMSFFMSNAEGNVILKFSNWEFQANGRNLLKDFFESSSYQKTQFFPFGLEAVAFTRQELLHSLDYAFRFGLFREVPFNLLESDRKLVTDNEHLAQYFAKTSNGQIDMQKADQYVKSTSRFNEYIFLRSYMDDIYKDFVVLFKNDIRRKEEIFLDTSFLTDLDQLCNSPFSTNYRMGYRSLSSDLLKKANVYGKLVNLYSTPSISFWLNMHDKFQLTVAPIVSAIDNQNVDVASLDADLEAALKGTLQSLKIDYERDYDRYSRKLLRLGFRGSHLADKANPHCLENFHLMRNFMTYQLFDFHNNYFKDVHAAMTLLKALEAGYYSVDGRYLNIDRFFEESLWNGVDSIDVRNRVNRLVKAITDSGLANAFDDDIITRYKLAINHSLGTHNITSPYLRSENGAFSQELGFFVDGVGLGTTNSILRSDAMIRRNSSISSRSFLMSDVDTDLRIRRWLTSLSLTGTEDDLMSCIKINGPNSDECLSKITKQYNTGSALFPNLSVTLPNATNLDKELSEEGNSNIEGVNYVVNQKSFVTEAMTKHMDQFNWYYNSHGPEDLQRRRGYLFSLYQENYLDISTADISPCHSRDLFGNLAPDKRTLVLGPNSQNVDFNELPKDRCILYKVSPEDFLADYIKESKFLHINDKDLEILKYNPTLSARYGTKNSEETVARSYFQYGDHYKDTQKWTYFDEFYKRRLVTYSTFSYDSKGGNWTAVQVDHFRGRGEFKDFWDTYNFLDKVKLLYPLNSYLKQQTRQIARRQIFEHLSQIQAFESATQRIEIVHGGNEGEAFKLPKVLQDPFSDLKLEVVRSKVHHSDDLEFFELQVKKRTNGEPIYLTRPEDSPDDLKAVAWFRTVVRAYFVDKVDCAALPGQSDPDYALYPEVERKGVECREQFKEYYERMTKAMLNQSREFENFTLKSDQDMHE